MPLPKDFEVKIQKAKSPSQRLRYVLYVYWEQKEIKEDFQDFYEAAIERVIDKVKAKLKP